MSVRENLIKAKALIDTPEKWMKGPNPCGGRMCAIRAVEKAIGGIYSSGWYAPEGKALQSELDKIQGKWSYAVVVYNDLKTTTHADIMALFDRAIEAAE